MPWGDPTPDGTSFTTDGGTPLTLSELERISVWIAQGAPVADNCCPATH
jgi:hypothetical protein